MAAYNSNKKAFFFLQKLAKEFNLVIILTYGAILTYDIVTHDIFFYQNEEIVDYLSIKCLHFNYKHLPKEVVVKSRIIQNSTKIILDYMKQHLIVFTPNYPVFCKQRMRSYNLCLQFKFKECLEENPPLYSDIPCDDEFRDFKDDDDDDDDDDDNDDDEVDRTETPQSRYCSFSVHIMQEQSLYPSSISKTPSFMRS